VSNFYGGRRVTVMNMVSSRREDVQMGNGTNEAIWTSNNNSVRRGSKIIKPNRTKIAEAKTYLVLVKKKSVIY